MQSFKTPTIISFLYLLMIAVSLSACKQKGCTDKTALNYNSAAGEEDGSCIFCSTSLESFGSLSYCLADYNPKSLYYMDTVLYLTYTNYFLNYNISSCGTDSCITSVNILNLTRDTIEFTAEIKINNPISYNILKNQKVNPKSAVDVEIASYASSSYCGTISKINTLIKGNIIYH